tara:strand:- start:244 stop:453 length:210 start_codon:yes stop_codon:yes gene_type:complete
VSIKPHLAQSKYQEKDLIGGEQGVTLPELTGNLKIRTEEDCVYETVGEISKEIPGSVMITRNLQKNATF